MKEMLQQRLQTLKTEYEAGQKMLADLEAKQANVRDTLLRISGAIQVLEETLAEDPEPSISDNGEVSSEVALTEVSAIPG
jgi:predicted nuclease with TOPRIM domain